ncbi:hypothetical protein M569_01936 [Genlisea aurea]|uniref:S-protein homolog n=1 Tax=Genlisea aurea TaxID=192259 RepID=S8EAG3_9LAMI|nr:hypothetical protein M569_01936 [Genlisea aurea]
MEINNLLLLGIWILFLGLKGVAEACILEREANVYIVRSITSNNLALTFHCFSGDDDIGMHILHGNQSYHWSFCPNVLPTTKWMCRLSWGLNLEAQFVSYQQNFPSYYNLNIWIAKDDGVYLSHAYSFVDIKKMYDWNKI